MGRNRAALAEAQRELAMAPQGAVLEWEFDGAGVFGHAMTLKRLSEITSPLGQTLRGMARDTYLLEGSPYVGSSVRTLSEPVVTGTFEGSFGLQITGPPVPEQPSFDGTLFERSADRLVSLLGATHAPEPEAEIVSAVAGLRRPTVNGLRRLSTSLARDWEPSQVRWRGHQIVTMTPVDATVLKDTLRQVTPIERKIVVEGVLELGDIGGRGQFRIVDGNGKSHSGKAEEGLAGILDGIPLGSAVRARLTEIETESPFFDLPRVSYVLNAIEVIGRGDSLV